MTDKEILTEILYREYEVERLLIHVERYLRSMEALNNDMRKKVVEPGEFEETATKIRGLVNHIHKMIDGGL